MIHADPHPRAGQQAKLKPRVMHATFGNIGGETVTIVDWLDRRINMAWADAKLAKLFMAWIYMKRVQRHGIPDDDEILYCKLGEFIIAVHATEIEEEAR